jgi:hypothetical protein
MAGTDDDNTTSADDWRLANIELAFITEVVRAERLAKDLLFDGLDKGLIRWRCGELTVDEDPDFSSNPPLVTSLTAARQFFWRRATHSRIDVDWPCHHVARVGPVMRLGSNSEGDKEERWPIFDMRGSVTLKASLVRFHHGDIVNYLVMLGLMPQPIAPVSDTASSQNAADVDTAPAPPSRPQPLSEEPKKRQPEEAKRWLVEMMINDPPGGNWNEWARSAYKKMQEEFGKDIPWKDWGSLRRRMNDEEVQAGLAKNRAK